MQITRKNRRLKLENINTFAASGFIVFNQSSVLPLRYLNLYLG